MMPFNPWQNQPVDGYLQFRNDTTAVFSCSLGHVFLPELERTKAVRCLPDGTWDRRIGSCYPFDYLRQYGNDSILATLEAKYPTFSSSSAQFPYGGGGGGRDDRDSNRLAPVAPAQNQVKQMQF